MQNALFNTGSSREQEHVISTLGFITVIIGSLIGYPSAGVWHEFTYQCDKSGWWKAKAGSETILFGVASLLVIPEVPLAAATALIACFAGLGYKRLRQKKP